MDYQEPLVINNDKSKKAKKEMTKAGLFFMLITLGQLPLSVLFTICKQLLPNVGESILSILLAQVYLIFFALLFVLVFRKKFTEDMGMYKYKISTFFLSLLVLITASPMATELNLLSQLFDDNETSKTIIEISTKVPFGVGILLIGAMPGFTEELIYRGIVYQAFRKRSILTGIVISALSFGLMHMNFNQILYAVYLGALFAFLVEATGSILSSMFLHMTFNTFNTSLIYVLPKLYGWLGKIYPKQYQSFDWASAMNKGVTKQQIITSMTIYAPFAVIGIVLTVLLIMCIAKINNRPFEWKRMKGDPEITSQVPPVSVPIIIGWLFCISMAILDIIK